MGLPRRIVPLWSSKTRSLGLSGSHLRVSSHRAPLPSYGAYATASRTFAIALPTTPAYASKRLRGLRKRAGGAASGSGTEKGTTTTASSPSAAAASSSSTTGASPLAPSAAPPAHPSPRNAKEAAAMANARLEYAIKENARTFMTLHEQQQQQLKEKQRMPQGVDGDDVARATLSAKSSATRLSASRGNRSRKRRAATPASSSPVAPTTRSNSKTTSPHLTTTGTTHIANSAATAHQSSPSTAAEEDEAEAAAIAAAVEKVLNAAAAASSATSASTASAASRPNAARQAATTSTPASTTAAKKSVRSTAHASTAVAEATAISSTDSAPSRGGSRQGVHTAVDDTVARAREAIASGKHKILAAAAAAVVTDVVHARAAESEHTAAALRAKQTSAAAATQNASVSSFASSLLGNDRDLETFTTASNSAHTTTVTTAAAPCDGPHVTTAKPKGSRTALKKTKKGRAAVASTRPALSSASSPPSASAGGLSPPADTYSSMATTSPTPASAPPAPPAARRGRRLSDDAAALATATAIVRRLTAFTGLNREQQSKLKRLLLSRQQRLLRRRRRVLAQRARRAKAEEAAARRRDGAKAQTTSKHETALTSSALGGFTLAGAVNGGLQGAMERTMTSLAPASSARRGQTGAKTASSSKTATRGSTKRRGRLAPEADPAPKATGSASTTVKTPKGVNPLLTPDYRERVVTIFERLAEVNLALGEKYKTQSYVAAVEKLKKGDMLLRLLPPHLKPVDESTLHLYGNAEQVQEFLQKRMAARTCAHIPFVGDKLKRKITTILETGELAELDALEQKPVIQAIKELTQVHGVGPRTALTLYKDFGIASVEALKAYVEAQDKAAAAGSGRTEAGVTVGKTKKKAKGVFTATDAQRLGLKYHKDILHRIPHSEGRLHEAFLKLRLKKHFGEKNYELVVCGSYRRECPDSGDIDVLITPTTRAGSGGTNGKPLPPQEVLSAFLDVLRAEKYVEATLAQGPTKFMGMCRLRTTKDSTRRFPARRLDIRFVDADSFAAALLYFTGSKNFNVLMRAEAIKHDFVLNEYGLFRNRSRDARATTELHEAISKLSKAQFHGGQPSEILKRQEKRLKEEAAATGGGATAPKQKVYTKAELQALSAMWESVEAQRVKCTSEEDVFEAIGMTYVSPKDRNL